MHVRHVRIGLAGTIVLGISHQVNIVAQPNTFVHFVIEPVRAKADVQINDALVDVAVLHCLQVKAQTRDLKLKPLDTYFIFGRFRSLLRFCHHVRCAGVQIHKHPKLNAMLWRAAYGLLCQGTRTPACHLPCVHIASVSLYMYRHCELML